jgi:putative FmdB family regulatory protein
MPIYEYRCAKGHTFEELQRMTDDPLTTCTVCGAPVQRVFHPVAVHFKGSGFYSTDYGKKKKAGAAAESSSKSDSKPDSSSKSSSDAGSSKSESSSKSSSSD